MSESERAVKSLLPVRFYRALLHCYPASFRREYGPELCTVFARRTAHLVSAPGILLALSLAVADVVPNALLAHADILARDLRQALRAMRRAPLLFGGSLSILALGIGANGAVFSILQAVLLQPLPYQQPDRVVMLWRDHQSPVGTRENREIRNERARGILTPEMLTGWRAESKDVLSDLAGVIGWQNNLEAQFDLPSNGHTERLHGSLVTSNFFSILGVDAAVGRVFSEVDERENATPVVISHGLWQRAFGGNPSIVGQSLTMVTGRGARRAPRTFTIAGVLPRAFRFTYPEETEAWVMLPWADVARMTQQAMTFRTVGRLAPGVSMESVQARVAGFRSGVNPDETRPGYRRTARVEPIEEWVVGNTRPSLLLLGGVALLLFLITCTTVANALFIRVTSKQRELAVRSALGADPGRLVRQLLTEGVLLAVLGALAGSLAATALAPVLRALVPSVFPRADEIGVNSWILLFAAAAAALVVILAALAPAWRGRRSDLVTILRRTVATASTDHATTRWRRGLVGVQSAIATSLLIIAVLLTTSLWRMGQAPLGFDGEKVVTLEMRMIGAKYRDADVLHAYQTELMARIRATPGVIEAGITSAVPFRGVDFVRSISNPAGGARIAGNERVVDAAYFSVMRIGLRQGRLFTEADDAKAPPVVVVSELFARRLFGQVNPIGREVDLEPKRTVIGVVRDVRYQGMDREPQPAYYIHRAQEPSELICIVARVSAHAAVPMIRNAVNSIDPSVPVMNTTSIDRIISESVAGRRFYTTSTIAFAALALMLTVAGLVLIVARSVEERKQELAIRLALGATTTRLVQLVTRQGLVPVIAGTAIGVAMSLIGARFLTGFLYQVSPREPVVYVAVAVLIALTGGIAALVPAMRVGRTAPAAVMRAE